MTEEQLRSLSKDTGIDIEDLRSASKQVTKIQELMREYKVPIEGAIVGIAMEKHRSRE